MRIVPREYQCVSSLLCMTQLGVDFVLLWIVCITTSVFGWATETTIISVCLPWSPTPVGAILDHFGNANWLVMSTGYLVGKPIRWRTWWRHLRQENGKQQKSQPSPPSQLRFNDTLLKSRSFPCRSLSDFASTGGNSLKNLFFFQEIPAPKKWAIDKSNQGKKQHIFWGNQVVSREASSELQPIQPQWFKHGNNWFSHAQKNMSAESHIRDWLNQHLQHLQPDSTENGGKKNVDESRVWWWKSILY